MRSPRLTPSRSKLAALLSSALLSLLASSAHASLPALPSPQSLHSVQAWGWSLAPAHLPHPALLSSGWDSPLFALYQRPWLLSSLGQNKRQLHAAWLSQAPLELSAEDERWPMPTQRPWPIHNGQPVITAPRVQELRWTMEPRRNIWWVLSRYRIRLAELERLNPGVDLDNLELGQELVVWRRDPSALSQSVGRANMGRLLHGEPLPRGEGYVVLYDHRAFGTYYTVSELYRVLNNFHHAHPQSHPLIIGDLSYSNGRRIEPHLSHRSGRDVDITYPRTTPPQSLLRFNYIRRREIDLDQTLDLIRDLLAGGTVELILIDRPIQRLLAARAEELGAPQQWLEAVFQHPYRSPDAIIKDARGHDDHMHVRFSCQPTDYRCR